MPSRSLLRSFLALWIGTGIVLVVSSAATLRAALAGPDVNPHLAVLAGIETIAAGLFLIPRTMRLGAIGLLVTLIVANVVHAAIGELEGGLIVYLVVVLFVMVHGPLEPSRRMT